MVISLMGYHIIRLKVEEINTILRIAYHGLFNTKNSDIDMKNQKCKAKFFKKVTDKEIDGLSEPKIVT